MAFSPLPKMFSHINSFPMGIKRWHCEAKGFNPWPDNKFRLFQTERVCRRQFHIWRKWKEVIQTGRKHCGKRRNCSLRAISPFPTVFSKGLFPRGRQKVSLCGNGLRRLLVLLREHLMHLLSRMYWIPLFFFFFFFKNWKGIVVGSNKPGSIRSKKFTSKCAGKAGVTVPLGAN